MFRKLVLAFALVCSALLGVAIIGDRVAVRSIEQLKQSHDHELDVANVSRSALRLMIDMETGQRGFLLTGEPKFLEPYDKAHAQLADELGKLRTSVADDAESLALVTRLDELSKTWMRDVGEPSVAARRLAPPGPPSNELLEHFAPAQGKALVDQLRVVSQELRDHVHADTVATETVETAKRGRTRHVVELGAVCVALFAFLVAVRTMRRLDHDVQRLAHDADRVASGQYARKDEGALASPILERIEAAMSRATEAIASRDAESKTLLTVSREISAASSMSALASRVQENVAQLLPSASLAIVRLLPDNTQRVLASPPELPLALGTLDLPTNSVYRNVMDRARAFVVRHPGERRYAEDAVVTENGFATYAVISVFVGDHAFAVVFVALRTGPLEPSQVTFLETLVQQIAHQIEAAELRDSLSSTNEELLRATNAKSEFLAMMSHELRTPLNSVVGFAEVLADRKFGDLNDKQSRFIGNVLDSGRHLLRLINDLLDLSKIEAGQVEVTRHRCNPRQLAVEVSEAVRPIAESRKISIVIDDAMPPQVIADAVRVKQILFNFLSNALKFAPFSGHIEITFSHASESVRISVRDNGPGISREEQERLFKPFSQVERTMTSGSSLGGTGLGLALARQLSHLMQGRVGVQSEPGNGATFWLELPRGAQMNLSTPPSGEVGPPGAPMALVVDDDPAARELVELALQSAGYRTASAASGEEALSAARRIRPHVITLDVFLPGIDGWDVLRVLNSDAATRGIPVVMLTISNDRQKALTLGAVEHLVKPFDQEALQKAIPPVGGEGPVMRVLLIDDDPAQVMRMREELTARGFEVQHAGGGADGLAMLRGDARIDLVLLDSVLRDSAASELVETLRANPRTREVPVVLLAHGDDGTNRGTLSRMVQAVLDKSKLGPTEFAKEVGGVVLELARANRG